MGHPRSPDFPFQFHFALLGFLLELEEGTPLCEPPLASLPCPPPGTCPSTGYRWITHDHGRPGHSHTCSSDPDPQYPPRTAKPGKGELANPILVQLLTVVLRLVLGLCQFRSTIRLFLVSSPGAWAVPPHLMGLLPTFQISLTLSPLRLLFLWFYVPQNSRLSW